MTDATPDSEPILPIVKFFSELRERRGLLGFGLLPFPGGASSSRGAYDPATSTIGGLPPGSRTSPYRPFPPPQNPAEAATIY